MLTCADCKAIDCANVGIDTNACDNFTGVGVGAEAPSPIHEWPEEKLIARIEELEERADEMEHQFYRFIDGIRKATAE